MEMVGLTLRVDEEGLFASDGMSPDDGVLVDDGLPPLNASAPHRSIRLLNSRVPGLKPMQSLLEQRAQAVVRLSRIGEEGISTSAGEIQDVQKGCPGWLGLVGNVRVPRH